MKTHLILASALLLMPTLAISAPQKARTDKTQKTEATQKQENTDNESQAKAEEQQVDENSLLGRMVTTARDYFAAKTPHDKLSYVINPKETEAQMRDFYFREPLTPGTLAQISTPQSIALNGKSFWQSNFALADGRTGTLFMSLENEMTPKIDWASQVRYSIMNWDEWLAEKNAPIVDFRVLAQVDAYYTGAYTDRSKYLSIKVKSPDSAQTIFAYLNLKDMDQLDFALIIKDGQAKDCVLSLKKIETKDGITTAIVEKVISPSWLISNTVAKTK